MLTVRIDFNNNFLVSGAEDTVEHSSVPENSEQPSVLENDATIAADASEESKSPNQKEGESVSEEGTYSGNCTGKRGHDSRSIGGEQVSKSERG
jgi:hypothetical protein